MNKIQIIIAGEGKKAISNLKKNCDLITKTDYLLLRFFDNVFIVFNGEDEAKKQLTEEMLNIGEEYSLTEDEANKIFKVFKLLQYVTLLSEHMYVTNKTIEQFEEEINDENRHIISPIIMNMHEGIINKVLKIYDKTLMKKERSFSLINIQRDYNLPVSTLSSRELARNALFAHLSLDHSEADQSQFQDYTKIYLDIKSNIQSLLDEIAPLTANVYNRIILLNDKIDENSLGRLYSNQNYHKLAIHTDEQFEKYYLDDFQKEENNE